MGREEDETQSSVVWVACLLRAVACSLCEWLQQILGTKVHNVHVTDRLFTSPAVLVQGDFGLSPTMQRYMKQQAAAQGVSEQELYGASLNQPILELNPYHPIIQRLDNMVGRCVFRFRARRVVQRGKTDLSRGKLSTVGQGLNFFCPVTPPCCMYRRGASTLSAGCTKLFFQRRQ